VWGAMADHLERIAGAVRSSNLVCRDCRTALCACSLCCHTWMSFWPASCQAPAY
jgi:hypothetical protein